ncbi:MAG: flagellar hook-length control protein FliK [Nitrospiraceae bacterium]
MLQDTADSRPAVPEAPDGGSSAGLQAEELQTDDQPSEEPATAQAVVDHILTGFADVASSAQAAPMPVDGKAASATSPIEPLLETMPVIGPQVQVMPEQNGGGARTTEEVSTDQAQACSQQETASGNKPINAAPASSTTIGENVREIYMTSGQAVGRMRTDEAVMRSPDRQLSVAATPRETAVSFSETAGPTEPRLTGPQGDLPSVAAAAYEPRFILYGGRQAGGVPIGDDPQVLSIPVGLGGDQTEWVMSVKPFGDPASSARTGQDQSGGNGEPAGSGSSFHGDPAQGGTALGGQSPSAGQGSETRSAAPLLEPVRPTLQSTAMWDPSAPRALRLELQSPDGPPVRLHVSLVEQTVHATVMTDHTEVQDFLLKNQSRLESQLHHHGLEMGQFSVLVDREGQGPSSYGWETNWSQPVRQGQEPSADVVAAIPESVDPGGPRHVNLFI